jgi:hypothetical protein
MILGIRGIMWECNECFIGYILQQTCQSVLEFTPWFVEMPRVFDESMSR